MKDKVVSIMLVTLIIIGSLTVLSFVCFYFIGGFEDDQRIKDLNKKIKIRELEIKLEELNSK